MNWGFCWLDAGAEALEKDVFTSYLIAIAFHFIVVQILKYDTNQTVFPIRGRPDQIKPRQKTLAGAAGITTRLAPLEPRVRHRRSEAVLSAESHRTCMYYISRFESPLVITVNMTWQTRKTILSHWLRSLPHPVWKFDHFRELQYIRHDLHKETVSPNIAHSGKEHSESVWFSAEPEFVLTRPRSDSRSFGSSRRPLSWKRVVIGVRRRPVVMGGVQCQWYVIIDGCIVCQV